MKTGFDAYWIYLATKLHFKHGFDIAEKGIPRKEKFIKKWNSERVEKDGKLFAMINEKFSKRKQLIYLYSIYFYVLGEAYPATIIEDDYQLYYTIKDDLENIEELFVDDVITLIEYCQKNKITIKDLVMKQPEKFFTLRVSPVSLVVFNIIFKFSDVIEFEKINTLERKKIEERKKRIELFQKIVYNDLCKVDWLDKIKQVLKK